MDKKLDTLYDLCETVSKELETANEKIRNSGGELSAGDLEYLDKLTHTMKSLKSTIAMIEASEEGYSGYYWDGRYYYDGNMSMDNRGGRGSNRGGNSYGRGRNSYGMRSSRGRYSRDDNNEDFIEEIEELMEKAPDEQTRKKFERLLMEMK